VVGGDTMKFKVGDLVQLSAAGKKSNQNEHALGGWGIIYFIGESYADYPIHCEWTNPHRARRNRINFKPYELKFFKKSS